MTESGGRTDRSVSLSQVFRDLHLLSLLGLAYCAGDSVRRTVLVFGDDLDMPQATEIRELVASVPYWHHAYEISPGVTTPGRYKPHTILPRLKLPSDLRGKRAIDIGASDGFYTRALIEAGADVVAVDYRPKTASGFWVMERALGRSIEHRHANIYDLPSLGLGRFDLVLCLGVIYHLPDMARAFRILADLCSDQLLLESHVQALEPADAPLARYLPANTLKDDITNFWAPNIACLKAMAGDVGFSVRRTEAWGDRALFECGAPSHISRKYVLAYSTKTG